MHPIIEDLNRRYTAKKYDPAKRISPDDLSVILEALRLSPSSVNSQPWKFIVIESDEAKQRFHETFADNFPMNRRHAKEASHIILFAYHPRYTKEQYEKVVDAEVRSGHLPAEKHHEMMEKGLFYAVKNSDESGFNGQWTKLQAYLALGNALHTAARLGIDSTPMEGIDTESIDRMFQAELCGYECAAALALGYHHAEEDFNHGRPKARLPLEEVVTVL